MKLGLSPLVISAKTHRIWLVSFAQAKLTWSGSEATFGFWHAVVISPWTTATLAGHDAPWRNTRIGTPAATTAAMTAPAYIRRRRERRTWTAFGRPRSMSVLVRSSSSRGRTVGRG